MAHRPSDDQRVNNRLFVICGKGIAEDSFREAFAEYGAVEDVWVVKDRRKNEDRGIVYVTFSKASEAARAMEELNGRSIPNHPKPLKIVIANNKREGSTRDPREDERLVRLFVIIPKSYTDADLRKEFEQYGDLESVTVLRDRNSGESKGFGYVKYHRPYHAALAFENCDPTFKPKFAEPQRPRAERDMDEMYYTAPDWRGKGMKRPHEEGEYFGGYGADGPGTGSVFSLPPEPGMGGPPDQGPMEMLQSYPHSGATRLHITAPIGLTQQYLNRLVNLVPGLEYCDLNETTGIAYARYATPQCAAYARDHLDGFEYPIGACLLVKYDENQVTHEPSSGAMPFNAPSPAAAGDGDVRHKAALLLEKAGINPQQIMTGDGNKERVSYCNVLLPLPQPMRAGETNVAQRLFIVCQPTAISERILQDAFCRFGNLIDVYLLSGRNYGYAKYANKESALKAMQALHGQNLAGQRIKVLEAEPPKPAPNEADGAAKKPRV